MNKITNYQKLIEISKEYTNLIVDKAIESLSESESNNMFASIFDSVFTIEIS